MIILASPSGIEIPQSQVTGLPAALAAKADDASAVHKTGAIAETITGAKTFTSTVTASVSNATLATVVRMANPDPTVTNGVYDWKIGGIGVFNGELQLVHTTGTIARFNSGGIVLTAGHTLAADTNGGIVYLQNGNTAATFDASGLNLFGLTRILMRIAGATVGSITSALSYFTSKLVTGATSLGSAGAQLESRSPDASTPIQAWYDYLGVVAVVMNAAGTQLQFRGASGGVVLNSASTSYLQYTGGTTELVSPGNMAVRTGGSHQFQNSTGSISYLALSSTLAEFSVAVKLASVADASIPNGGIGWSTDTPGALKCRTPAGVLKTIALT